MWIIRQLNIETAVNVTGEPEHISRALTTQIARNLGATLRDENQDNVRHFLIALNTWRAFCLTWRLGTHGAEWYYESFAGLKALPLSSALRPP